MKYMWAVLLILIVSIAAPALAQQPLRAPGLGYAGPPPGYQAGPPPGAIPVPNPTPNQRAQSLQRLAFGFGVFDLEALNRWPYDTLTNQENDAQAALQVEYRGPEIRYGLAPMFGGRLTSGRQVLVYGGINWNIEVTPLVYLMPNVAAGFYDAGNEGEDLGGNIQFRSGIELGYITDIGTSIGLALSHTSNAGLEEDNPGAETLMLNYTVPYQIF